MIFHVDPCAKPRMTQRDKWKKRPSVLRYFAYRDAIRVQAGEWRPNGELTILFYLAMPKSWSGKKKALMIHEPHRQTPDLDNLIKGFLDIWEEDKQVWCLHAEKLWGQTGAIVVQC